MKRSAIMSRHFAAVMQLKIPNILSFLTRMWIAFQGCPPILLSRLSAYSLLMGLLALH
ncbi:hypothetical protein JOE11_000338 [Robbsia andropogonis]